MLNALGLVRNEKKLDRARRVVNFLVKLEPAAAQQALTAVSIAMDLDFAEDGDLREIHKAAVKRYHKTGKIFR